METLKTKRDITKGWKKELEEAINTSIEEAVNSAEEEEEEDKGIQVDLGSDLDIQAPSLLHNLTNQPGIIDMENNHNPTFYLSTSINTIKPLFHIWDPKTDITVYELARAIEYLALRKHFYEGSEELAEPFVRHFKFTNNE